MNLRCDQLNGYNLKPANQGEELFLQEVSCSLLS